MNNAVTPLPTERHIAQRARWPQGGQHILAHHDAGSVVVYQAYRPAIGEYAIRHGRLDGPDFSLSRMSWIKPNFLWMMYRCGWGTKEGQEVTLGLGLRGRTLAAFAHEELLEVIDMRAFVDAQRPLAQNDNAELQLPVEHPLDIGH